MAPAASVSPLEEEMAEAIAQRDLLLEQAVAQTEARPSALAVERTARLVRGLQALSGVRAHTQGAAVERVAARIQRLPVEAWPEPEP
eukprot:SAG11_NODE_8433_length_1016_cov_0.929117_1_plen_86_part_10